MAFTAGWSEFYVATAGAAAALAGLIVVAISVTIKEILGSRSLPSRAGATISSLMLALIAASLGLIPDQPPAALGIELAVASAVALGPIVLVGQRMATDPAAATAVPIVLRVLLLLIPVACTLAGGLLVAAGLRAGLSCVAAGIVLILITGMLNAWVLLVEVRR